MTDIDPATLSIIHYPDPRLRQSCRPVEAFDATLRRTAERMLRLMHEAKGVGLAAPQVGLSIRMFVCNVSGEPGDDVVVVNPELVDGSGAADLDEGCLSIPEVTVMMRRHQAITLRAQTLSGDAFEKRSGDLEGRVWQHETDHLNGVLIIDRMSEGDRIANRKAIKRLEDEFPRDALRA